MIRGFVHLPEGNVRVVRVLRGCECGCVNVGGQQNCVDNVDHAIGGNDVGLQNCSTVNRDSAIGCDGDVLTLDSGDLACSHVSGHDRAGDCVVGQDLDEEILVLGE